MFDSSTILVIDDEPNLQITLAAILHEAGYRVITAGSAGEALHCLANSSFDLIFLDLQMPDMDGLSLLSLIRQDAPEMPVLILTAHASMESAIQAVRQGANDYLLKPAAPQIILERVAEVLYKHRESQRRQKIVQKIQGLAAELQQIDRQAGQPETALLTASSRTLQRGDLLIDLYARYVTWRGELLPLTPSSFDYLVTLARHSPNPVSAEDLVMQSQGYQLTRHEANQMVRWRIHQLRTILELNASQPKHILTVRGVGYRFLAD